MDDIPLNSDITYFARTHFRDHDTPFGIKRKDRRQHMYVLGKSGTGKSSMLSNMIIQDIRNGRGVCVVDPHGELVEELLDSIPANRLSDVIYFNPADIDYHIGFNVLELEDKKYKHLVASGLMGIFTKIWANAWSSRMEYILNNCILALLDTPGSTLLGIPRILTDKSYREKIIANVEDPVVRAFWIHEYEAWQDRFRNEAIAPIQNKVGQFLSTSIIRNIVGQSKSTINIFDIMNQEKIFLVNVSKGRVGEDNSALLGGMLITKIQLAAMERVRIPEDQRKDFYLYVDEFQNFVTEAFANVLSEARKYRLNLTLAHQYIAQLENEGSQSVKDAVFGNVGTMITFRIGATDAEFMQTEYEPEFEAQDFVMLPNYHIYLKLLVDGVTTRPFSAKTLPPFELNRDPEKRQLIIDSSRELYTYPREHVEKEINEWSGMTGSTDDKPGDGKFEAECSICGKTTYVPFEPIEGLPVYCKEHHLKVKTGEIDPVPAKRVTKKPKENKKTSYGTLSEMGIEFKPASDQKRTVARKTERRQNAPTEKTKKVRSKTKPDISTRKTFATSQNKRDRTEPDKLGLQELLKEALGEGAHHGAKKVPEETNKKHGSGNTSQTEQKKETVSLKKLKPSEQKSKQLTKRASKKNISALRNVLSSLDSQNATSKPEIPEEKNQKPVDRMTPDHPTLARPSYQQTASNGNAGNNQSTSHKTAQPPKDEKKISPELPQTQKSKPEPLARVRVHTSVAPAPHDPPHEQPPKPTEEKKQESSGGILGMITDSVKNSSRDTQSNKPHNIKREEEAPKKIQDVATAPQQPQPTYTQPQASQEIPEGLLRKILQG